MGLTWPLADHLITRGFAYLSSIYVGGQHAALDLIRRTGATRASPILAVAYGTVAGVGWDMYSGFFIAIDHRDGWRSTYRHMYGQAPVVVGQHVNRGQSIGNVGNTGWSLGDHLHFDLWHRQKKDSTAFYKNGWWAHNPTLYLTEDEMPLTDADKQWIRNEIGVQVKKMPFQARRHDGTGYEAITKLEQWLGRFQEHRDDSSKHKAGKEHDHPFSGRTGKA